jgi:hypothetical protein
MHHTVILKVVVVVLIADKQNILGLCQQWTIETTTKKLFSAEFSFNR